MATLASVEAALLHSMSSKGGRFTEGHGFVKDVIVARYNSLPLAVSEDERHTSSSFVIVDPVFHSPDDEALAHVTTKFAFRYSETIGNNIAVNDRVVAFVVVLNDHFEIGLPGSHAPEHRNTFFLEEQRERIVLSSRCRVNVMHGTQGLIDKLYRQRERLRAALDWQESLHSCYSQDADDGAAIELRDKITDVQREIANIERRLLPRH